MLYSESLTTYLYSEDGRLSGSVLNVDATYKSSAGYTYDGFGRLGKKETIVTLSGVTKFSNDKGIKDPGVRIYLPVKANGPIEVWDVKFVR